MEWDKRAILRLVWPLSFGLPNALRVAGDARYCLVAGASSILSAPAWGRRQEKRVIRD